VPIQIVGRGYNLRKKWVTICVEKWVGLKTNSLLLYRASTNNLTYPPY